MNGAVAHHTPNVKRWRDGQMLLRWIGAALHEAQRGFRRVRGHRDLAKKCAPSLSVIATHKFRPPSARSRNMHPRSRHHTPFNTEWGIAFLGTTSSYRRQHYG